MALNMPFHALNIDLYIEINKGKICPHLIRVGHMIFIWTGTNLETTNLACKYGHQCSRILINYKTYTCLDTRLHEVHFVRRNKRATSPLQNAFHLINLKLRRKSWSNDPASNVNKTWVITHTLYNELHQCYEKWLHQRW